MNIKLKDLAEKPYVMFGERELRPAAAPKLSRRSVLTPSSESSALALVDYYLI
jgi:hypothetical protein